MTATIALPLRVGARTIVRISRRLIRVPLSLDDALAGRVPPLPELPGDAHGYLVTSLPASQLGAVARSGLHASIRQHYARRYADLGRSFEDYLGRFSPKSRSTLRRKLRRFATRSGGAIDVRCYRTPDTIAEFHRHARTVSRSSYQERLLDAGLPDGEDAIAAMRRLAAADQVRGWLLFLDDLPISYLYAPASGATLIYAHLGYDPAFADLSPGTVLQLEALRMAMADRRFALFDFTEGDGQHKRQFATGSVDCVDVLLLRPTLANRAVAGTLAGFDAAIERVKLMVARTGLERAARRFAR